MNVLTALQCVVLLANCVMLVKLTATSREMVAGMDSRGRAVPDAEASVQTTLARIIGLLNSLVAGGIRIEAANAVVAVDLEQSHQRADATEGAAGEAADAASRSGEA